MIDVNLDEKYKKIIALLQENPSISQNEIAKKINLSQPAVGARIKKLRETGLLSYAIGINPEKVGLHFARLDISTQGDNRFISALGKCPYVLNTISVDGERNLSVFFGSEDFSTLESVKSRIIECNGIKNEQFNIILKSEKDIVLPLKLVEKGDKSFCSMQLSCEKCRYYENGKCIGCPLSPAYKGKLW